MSLYKDYIIPNVVQYGEYNMKLFSVLHLFIALLFIFSLISCNTHSDSQNSSDLDTLVSWMSGYFSSQNQSLQDSSYRDVRLHMIPVWRDRTDGYWLYVEQAVAEFPDKPYRQRVYHLYQDQNRNYYSDVYTLNNPSAFNGAWQKEFPLAGLVPDSLELRAGCTTILQRISKEEFAGGTRGKNCTSSIRGGSYATSEVSISEGKITSWDRGFDTNGDQVWGAIKGGYIFDKIKSY